MVDEDRPDEVVLPLVLLAQGGTLLLSILHQPLNEVGTALTDHWSDGTVVLSHTITQAIYIECSLDTIGESTVNISNQHTLLQLEMYHTLV